MDVYEKSLKIHGDMKGKLCIAPKMHIKSQEDLSLLYTPGVAEACRKIHGDESLVNELTIKSNFVAVVSDGSAVLGLGNIGAKASMPVMEGKAVLFKEFGDVDAVPLCIDTQDPDKIVEFVKNISPTFGGINLEDISAPRCFDIERQLKSIMDIPIFHDDQHGTAVVVGAGLLNALKIVGKSLETAKIVLNGIGAAGVAISHFLISMGAKNLVLCDINGILNTDNEDTCLHEYHKELAKMTNPERLTGDLHHAIKNADVFIGISAGNLLTGDDIKNMNKDSIVFAMANPVPEIDPIIAKESGARIVATGRSDYPNQINNVLAFPGIFRGALETESTDITEAMKIDATKALANCVSKPTEDCIIPNPFDKKAVCNVALAVALSSIKNGVARKIIDEPTLRKIIEKRILS